MARPKFGGRADPVLRGFVAKYPNAIVTKNGGGHWRITFPNGQSVVGTFFWTG
jgi:hypothetical protein